MAGRTVVAQQLGQLTGTDFPIVDDTDGYGGYRVVQDTTARDNIPVNRRKPRMKVATITDSKEWILQSDLISWVESSSNQSQAINTLNLTELGALSTDSLTIGQKAYVLSLKGHWTLNNEAVPGTANPMEAIAATSGVGSRHWTRDVGGNPYWSALDTIYLDGISGSDENDGYNIGTPLKTYDEYARRTFGLTIINGAIINIANKFIITSPMRPMLNPDTFFEVLGTTSVIGTGTVTSHVDFNSATNTSQEVTATIAGNGIETYPLAYVRRTNSTLLEGFVGTSVVAGTARLRTNLGTTPANLSDGDTLSVEILPTCDNAIIIDSGSENDVPIFFNKINFTDTTECHKSVIFQTCTFTGSNGLTVHDTIQLFTCAFNCATFVYSGEIAAYATFFTDTIIEFVGYAQVYLINSLGQDNFRIVTNAPPNMGAVYMSNFEISHVANNIDGPLSGAHKISLDTIWGTNGAAISNALVSLEPGCICLYRGTNTATVSGGFVGKLTVPGGTDVTAATWADLPIVDTDTLSGIIRGA